MQITIVKADNLVLIDGQSQAFNLSQYDLPHGFWALQWNDQSGEVEYENNNQFIDILPDWTKPIIAEHQRLTDEQKIQQVKDNRQVIFLQNGQVRTERIQNQQATQKAKDQKTINDYVRSIM